MLTSRARTDRGRLSPATPVSVTPVRPPKIRGHHVRHNSSTHWLARNRRKSVPPPSKTRLPTLCDCARMPRAHSGEGEHEEACHTVAYFSRAARFLGSIPLPVKITIGAPGCWKSLRRSERFPERVQSTLSGKAACPREIRASRRASTGSPMVMVSAPTVVAPAMTASPSERISRNRALSVGEEKSEGVRFRVEILPSQVRAKFATTRGLGTFGFRLEPLGLMRSPSVEGDKTWY